jgi:hypothetical protein
MDGAKVKCGVSAKIARPNAVRLSSVGCSKTVVYSSELQDLMCEIETACAAFPFATIQNVCQSVARRCNNALLVVGILNICDFKCDNITILSLFAFEL